MAEDHRTPGADIIDIALAIGIEQIGTGRAVDEHRFTANAAKCTHRRVDATRDVALGEFETVVRSGHGRVSSAG